MRDLQFSNYVATLYIGKYGYTIDEDRLELVLSEQYRCYSVISDRKLVWCQVVEIIRQRGSGFRRR